ncbi:Methyltransferase type 11 [Magnetococcus marinus MC-1]|uniref:Methyltransferase type 11 n=1 Tax=Magnetococcus marinus (strain ATCC BAA-1437 / JCM 17883 / MC-1) TaxID=156889 RepID=A0L562_MAGMM|nr:class I SAM-dependent methyltransferase [Magnetococcus marinus]ABK43105.1 Methyltransferase type 11 [Magnetococcus marinus MC-1]
MSQALLAWLKKFYHALPRPPSSNYHYRDFSLNPYDHVGAGGVILDIGGKDARGCYAFGQPPAESRLICLDIMPGPGVDMVADAHDLSQLGEASVDLVIAVSALEHMQAPWQVVAEIYRVLKPGGMLYVNTPFVFPFHGDPDDFYRFSHHGLGKLCGAFECLESGFNRGPASTMVHVLIHFLAILCSFNRKVLYGLWVDVWSWLLFWIKYLDRWIATYGQAYVVHSGAYFIGRKPQ